MSVPEKELEGAIQIVREVMTDFLSQHTVYSLVPESSRVTVIDDDLPMVCAFQALAEQGSTAACVYDQKRGNFVSMLGECKTTLRPPPCRIECLACAYQPLSCLPCDRRRGFCEGVSRVSVSSFRD